MARTAKVRATVVHAPAAGGQPGTGAPGLRAARYADRRICHRLAPFASWFSIHYRNPVFGAFFHAPPGNSCWRGRTRRLLQEVRLPPVALRVPRVDLRCTWRGMAQVSALMYLAGSGGRTARREGVDARRHRRPGGRRYIPSTRQVQRADGAAGAASLPSRPRRPRGPRVTRRWPRPPRWCRGRRPRPGRVRGRRGRAGRCGACR